MEQSTAERTAKRRRAKGKKHKHDGGRQREAGPCRQTAEISGTHEADGEADLTARRAGQELAQCDEIGIGLFVEPATARDKLVAEISDMRDRPAEAGQTKLEKDEQNVRDGALLGALRLPRMNGGHDGFARSRESHPGTSRPLIRSSPAGAITPRHHHHRCRRHWPDRPVHAICGSGRPRACGRRRSPRAIWRAARARSPCRRRAR